MSGGGFSRHAPHRLPPARRSPCVIRTCGKSPPHVSRPRGIHAEKITISAPFSARLPPARHSREALMRIQPHNVLPLRRGQRVRRGIFAFMRRTASRPRGVHPALSGLAANRRRAPPARRSREALMRIQPHNIFPLRRGQRVRRGIFAPRSQIFCRRRRMYAYSTHIVTRRSADSCAASSTEARRLFIYGSVFRKSSA